MAHTVEFRSIRGAGGAVTKKLGSRIRGAPLVGVTTSDIRAGPKARSQNWPQRGYRARVTARKGSRGAAVTRYKVPYFVSRKGPVTRDTTNSLALCKGTLG